MGAGGCPVVIAQWQSTGCTSQVSWVRFPAAAGLFTFLYFRLITSKLLFVCLGLSVTVRVRAGAREWDFSILFFCLC